MKPLVNMKLLVNEISIKNNALPDGEFQVNPSFTRSIEFIDENHASVELIVKIINTEENPFPVDICVNMVGIFEISRIPKEELDYFLKVQAIQILFPYVRTMVTNITTSAMMPPIVFPVVDVRTLFKKEEKNTDPEKD